MSEREPITAELRRECVSSVQRAEVSVLSGEPVIETTLVIDGKVFDRICDAIDAVHAGLERENAELRQRVAVLDKRSENMHEISSATVTITDELRKWGYGFCGDTHDVVTAIADRIDAEHEAQLNDAFETRNSDENLESDGWVRLPVDADGEVIHVGDAVTCGANVWTVTGLKFLGEGWGICCTVYNEYGGSGTSVYPPSDLRHYHEPTVEDVLTKFGIDWEYEDNCEDRAALLKEYAAKLRLASNEE